MARNYEKRFTGLNRFLEAKQKEETKNKDVKRPPLHKLKSAEAVKRWIPSITKEIEYLLQQISGSRQYKEKKIEEFRLRVDELEKEYKQFVAKVQALDPSYKDVIPWKPRGYSRKRSHDYRPPARVTRVCEDHVSKGMSHDCHVRSHDDSDSHMVESTNMKIWKTLVKDIEIREPFIEEDIKLKEPFIDEDIKLKEENVKKSGPFVKVLDIIIKDIELREPFVEADIKLKEPFVEEDLKMSRTLVEGQVTSQDQERDLSVARDKRNELHLDYSSSSSESSGDKEVTVKTKIRRKQ